MSDAAILARLYGEIPKVRGCRPECSDCCGPVPMTAPEARAVPHVVRPAPRGDGNFLTPTLPCRSCAYSTPQGCAIYESRPLMCRLFGAVADEPMLECPHGAKAKRPLSRDAGRALVARYLAETGAL